MRLHHTATFERDQLWRFAADFKTVAGKRVGLKMTKKPEGAGEITVYFDPGIPDETKVIFIHYVHDHLKSKDPDLVLVRLLPSSDPTSRFDRGEARFGRVPAARARDGREGPHQH